MNFASLKEMTIPDGKVAKITDSTGKVIWEKQTSLLPSEYQAVEWVQAASGVGAYIDLGFSFDTKAKVYISQGIFSDQAASTYVFGAAENSGALRCMLTSPYSGNAAAYGSSGTSSFAFAVRYAGANATIGYKNVFIINFEPGNVYIQNLTNGTKSISSGQGVYTMSSKLYLFAQNYNGSPRFGDVRQIHYFKYYDKTDTLICDLIPCYRKSDGEIGMYDIVRKIFLKNVGTGTFTKGADVLEKGKYTNQIPLSTEADGKAIYNNGLGYKDGYRVRSGGAEAQNSSSTITGYIPYVKGDKLYIYPPFTGGNTYNAINFYDGSFTNIGQVTDSGSGYGICDGYASIFKTTVVNCVSVLDISSITVSGIDTVAYVRITNGLSYQSPINVQSGSGMIVTKNEEIPL